MANLFFFWGQEDFLINSEIEKIKSKYIDKTFESMAYKKLYEPNFDDVINALQTLPMMFGNIMYVIDVNKFFLSKDKANEETSSTDDFALKLYEKALQSVSDKNIVVFRCIIPKDSKKKVDSRKKIYKITTKYFQEKQFQIYRHYDKELKKIIADMGKNNGLELSQNVIECIIEQIGTNLGIINSELQKLSITIYPLKKPTEKDIIEICTKKDDVFSILLPLFNNDISKALYELKQVTEKSSIPEIMAAIQYSLRNFTIIKAYYNKIGKYNLAQKLHISEWIVEQNYNAVSKISGRNLLKLRKNLLDAEYSIKSGECVNQETLIEMVFMGVCDV